MSSTPSENRRRHERVSLNMLVQHRFASFDEFIRDETLDLSEGGMFLRTRTPRDVGSTVFFQLMLHNGARLLEGMGKVVRVVEPNKAGAPAGMAVQFLSLDEQSRNVLRDAVKKAHRAE